MTGIFRLHISLDRIETPIWRQIDVPENISLAALHLVIQEAMKWEDRHLYEFTHGNQKWGMPAPEMPKLKNARDTDLNDVVDGEGSVLAYTYDFGDHWQIHIEIDERSKPQGDISYPRMIAGERAGPPEDCGGVPGYWELVEQVENDNLPDYRRDLLGDWHPDEFDLNAFQIASTEELEERVENDSRYESVDVEPPKEFLEQSYEPEAIDLPDESKFSDPWINTMLELMDLDADDLPVNEDAARQMIRDEVKKEVRAEKRGTRSPSGRFKVPEPLDTYPVSLKLKKCLARLPVHQLDVIFDRMVFATRPSRRGEREDKIVEFYTSPGGVEEVLFDACQERHANILDYLLNFRRTVHAEQLYEEILDAPNEDWLHFEGSGSVAKLRRFGLVHAGLRKMEGEQHPVVGIPREIRDPIRDWI